MNKNSNLWNALKKAFEEHTEPLHEAQWDRLSAAMDEEKPGKKKFLPWVFSIIAIAAVSLAIGFWFGNNTDTLVNNNSGNDVLSVNSQTEQYDTIKKKNFETKTNNGNEKLTNGIAATDDLVPGGTFPVKNSIVGKRKSARQKSLVNPSLIVIKYL